MKVRHRTMLLAAALLTLTIGTVAGVNIRHGSITANPDPILTMSADANRVSDDELKEQLQNALNEDWDLREANIVVKSVDHGFVTLSGQLDAVSNEAVSYHVRAVELVANFPGVQRVKSSFQTPGALSGIDIWKDARESTEPQGGPFWNAWVVVPLSDDGDATRR